MNKNFCMVFLSIICLQNNMYGMYKVKKIEDIENNNFKIDCMTKEGCMPNVFFIPIVQEIKKIETEISAKEYFVGKYEQTKDIVKEVEEIKNEVEVAALLDIFKNLVKKQIVLLRNLSSKSINKKHDTIMAHKIENSYLPEVLAYYKRLPEQKSFIKQINRYEKFKNEKNSIIYKMVKRESIEVDSKEMIYNAIICLKNEIKMLQKREELLNKLGQLNIVRHKIYSNGFGALVK